MGNKEVYEKVTNTMLELIDKGTMPWQVTWGNGLPINAISKKAYSGVNIWLLQASAIKHGFKSNTWLTYKQASQLGGNVIRGSKGTFITYSSRIEKKETKNKPEEEKEYFWLLKYYNVFNLEQCENIDVSKFTTVEFSDNEIIENAEVLIKNYEDRPEITFTGNPCFVPSTDVVMCPSIENFKTSSEYYSALFHELVHSTGHEKRLNRIKSTSFGSHEYSKEELVAEFGASYLRAISGINSDFSDKNSASYIDSWAKKLKSDPKLIMQGATLAMKAVDYMQGATRAVKAVK